MKLQIISPLRMQWESYYHEVFPNAVWVENAAYKEKQDFDINLFMWCDKGFIDYMNGRTVREWESDRTKNIVFIRRYEWFAGYWKTIDWSKVSAVIMVNDYLAGQFESATGIKPHIVYNGVDPSQWTFREKRHGKNIAWVGFINQKKNLPLAMQILAELPEDYVLHVAGGLQDQQVFDYAVNLAPTIKRNIIFHGHIPHEQMDGWLEDKNYILSTAISEGCPNHVLEAMAKGIKPIVHNWPGAIQQVGRGLIFNTVKEAVNIITSPNQPIAYRELATTRFGLNQYQKVKDIVENVMQGALCAGK